MTAKQSAPKHKSKSPRLTKWHATENAPRRRWWWWLVFVYVTMFGTTAALYMELWTFAVLIVVMAIALGCNYASKPREIDYELEGSLLTTTTAGRPSTIDLKAYHQCYIDDPWVSGKQVVPTTMLVLIPIKRLAWATYIALPEDEENQRAVMATITKKVSLVEDQQQVAYRSTQRVLDWLVRRLRI